MLSSKSGDWSLGPVETKHGNNPDLLRKRESMYEWIFKDEFTSATMFDCKQLKPSLVLKLPLGPSFLKIECGNRDCITDYQNRVPWFCMSFLDWIPSCRIKTLTGHTGKHHKRPGLLSICSIPPICWQWNPNSSLSNSFCVCSSTAWRFQIACAYNIYIFKYYTISLHTYTIYIYIYIYIHTIHTYTMDNIYIHRYIHTYIHTYNTLQYITIQ